MQKFEPGPLTDEDIKAIREYQEDAGIKVDGDIWHQTWNTIRRERKELRDENYDLKADLTNCETENARLMHGIESVRQRSCTGCAFAGAVFGVVLIGAALIFS